LQERLPDDGEVLQVKHTIYKRLLPLLLIVGLALSGCSASEAVSVNVTNPQVLNPVVIQGVSEIGTNTTLRVDNLTSVLVILPYTHYELHTGDVFSYCAVANMTGNGNATYLLITPNSSIHIQFDVNTEAEASFEFYEGANTSNHGTPQTAINRARTSNITAQSLIYLTPSLTSLGTLLCERHWGSGKGVGGGASITEEWMLKPNTMYVIRVINKTVTPQWASVEASWYRH
jgi:hypothetical protein